MNPLEELIRSFFEAIGVFILAVFEFFKSLFLFPIYEPSSAFSLIVLIVAFFVGFLLPLKLFFNRIIEKAGVGDLDGSFIINLGRYILALIIYSVAGLCGVGMIIIAETILGLLGLY